MDKQHFDSKECSILLEALDAWEKGNSDGLIMSSLLGCMVAGDDEFYDYKQGCVFLVKKEKV